MISVLGTMQVHRGSTTESVDIGSPRHREVLAALVLDVGRVVSVDTLLDRVWGEGARGGTTANLHAVVSRLRSRLRDAGTGIEIATVPPGYRLDVPPRSVDAERFEALVEAARAACGRGELDAARRDVAQALGLWRGPAYADVGRPFAEAEAARLDGQRVAAVELGAEVDLAQGRHDEVLRRLPTLVEEQPLRESLRRLLMLALYRSGRQSDALAVYDDVRGRLAEELGLDPGPQLQELHQAILTQDEALLPGPAPAAPVTAAPPAPAVSAARWRSDVVPPSSALLGRERDVDYVRSLLESPTQRLVTLTGLGGVGKTRLAYAVAQAAQDDYRDGVVLVSLAPVGDPGSVLPELARALGLVGVEGQDVAAALVEHLRPRRLLLVLDNLEHLLPAAAPVARLVASCPDLRVLVTSRTALRVRSEVQYQVPPLPVPDPEESDAEALGRSAAVSLFLDRAAATSPGFDLDALAPEERAAVGAVCRRLAGLPLAIELAAARVRLLPPTMMLARLHEVLAAGGARDLPPRQRTMRSTLDWSHDLLSAEEQRLLRRLSVFVGGSTLDAVEAVAEDGPVLGVLEALVEHSLVLPDAEHPEVARFRVLEPIVQYADDLLVGPERLAARAAHRRHFRALAGTLEPAYRGPGTMAALAVTGREHANLVAAVESGLADGDADEAGWLAWDLWLYWWLSGSLVEGRRLITAALGAGLSDEVRVRLLAAHAAMAFAQGDLDPARESWAAAELLGERTGDTEGHAYGVAGRGLAALASGDLASAGAAFEESARLCEAAGAGRQWLWTLTQVWHGTVLLLQGETGRAAERVERAMGAARERADPLAVYVTLFTAAQVALAVDDPATAREHLEEGVRLSLETGDAANLAYFLESMGLVESLAGDHRRVAVLHGAAARLREAVGADVYGYYQPDEDQLREAVARSREALGETEHAAATEEGRRLTMPEAVTVALQRP
ncbi:AfsR/SARP family transcriptional regulator [Nocardioides anomalus]|uniref:AfsR/SARP family transcriptional regulator n=1 Tax=Nocardioides anomalus TaxID=2712223 RepID=A0A6G6W8K7_9ACTN|nr:BTAD domain-containing putative transcriptional regulator [Nocardioides anomalus]QIG41681.1 AfsR/SARP family transcriptional regulator [Nocardioides anomalus]